MVAALQASAPLSSCHPAVQNKTLYNCRGQIVKPCIKNIPSPKQTAASRQCNKANVPRFVHFGPELEQTRWFFKADSPKCASSDPIFDTLSSSSDHNTIKSAPTTSLTHIRGPSPSFSAYEESPVVLETLEYADNRLSGTVKVHNLAFEKSVTVRMTKDGWKTVEDVHATFLRSIVAVDGSRPGVDRFHFKVPLDIDTTAAGAITISMCVRYHVNGQEYWDNKKGANYEFKFVTSNTSIKSTSTSTSTMTQSATDAIEMRKQTNDTFSFDFAASLPSSISPNRVSSADTRRYMQYSEATFAPAVYPPAMHYSGVSKYSNVRKQNQWQPMPGFDHFSTFTASQWIGNYYTSPSSTTSVSSVHSADLCGLYSSYRTPSPIMHTDSPLTISNAWASYPRSLLHC
ncbi:hypothetical protein GGI26_006347 [Coemansia sp. RSA 1358]|nr:hypothetical protein GGI26_006347 [Coemansia sp. RSA 1358]